MGLQQELDSLNERPDWGGGTGRDNQEDGFRGFIHVHFLGILDSKQPKHVSLDSGHKINILNY